MNNDTFVREGLRALLRQGAYEAAIATMQRHAPQLEAWLMGQIPERVRRRLQPALPSMRVVESEPEPEPEPEAASVEMSPVVQADTELARVARLLGEFNVWRIWVYLLRQVNDGCGWVDKQTMWELLEKCGVTYSKRQQRRLLRKGLGTYWTVDERTQRVYLTGAVQLAGQLVKRLAATEHADTLATNKPGVRRMCVDLSGAVEDAQAQVYGAWLERKNRHGQGVTISRETLQRLWGVSTPTLLDWEERANIRKQTNYAQQNETGLHDNVLNVPRYAYLCLNKDGSEFVSWRLPNTYLNARPPRKHPHTGNARRLRQHVNRQLQITEQPGSKGDAGSLRSGRLYFVDEVRRGRSPFKALDAHLRKHQDPFTAHYAALGGKYEIALYERTVDHQRTWLHQRDYAGEYTAAFIRRRAAYDRLLDDMWDYYDVLEGAS